MAFSPGTAPSIRGLKSALALSTRGGSRGPELGTLGSVRGALSNERPYRDPATPLVPNNVYYRARLENSEIFVTFADVCRALFTVNLSPFCRPERRVTASAASRWK